MIASMFLKSHPSGAKARHFGRCFCGTTEVVPCYKTMLHSRFIASNEILCQMEGIFA
jgi:hypothetical protein